MDFLTELWMPIILSAVFVFIVSSILHMVLPFHRSDFQKMPGEDQILEEMRKQGLARGEYMFPCAESLKASGTPEMLEKFNRGPIGILTVLPNGAPAMGKSLVQWFIYSILISVLVAYIASHTIAAGANYMTVFRVAGVAAILGYACGAIPNSIWKGVSWGTTSKFIFDGVVYGLVTAGTFGWLWPGTQP